MKAEIKEIDCIDHDPIDKWIPDNVSDINVYIVFHIGPKNEKGSELFTAHIVTPNNVQFGKNEKYIKVENYSLNYVVDLINDLLETIEAKTWHEIAINLNNFMDWEFDHYYNL